jgi:hypothetical protein
MEIAESGDASIPFDEYVALTLARMLPYRKPLVVFGPEVCESELALKMMKSAFFIGVESRTMELWHESPHRQGIEQMSALLSENLGGIDVSGATPPGPNGLVESVTYDGVFAPDTELQHIFSGRLTFQECVGLLTPQVVKGVVSGREHYLVALAMENAWLIRDGGWDYLRVSGLGQYDFRYGVPTTKTLEDEFTPVESDKFSLGRAARGSIH